jgi:hypothetical protein
MATAELDAVTAADTILAVGSWMTFEFEELYVTLEPVVPRTPFSLAATAPPETAGANPARVVLYVSERGVDGDDVA